MKDYVITFNQIDNNSSLTYGLETIKGIDAKSALESRFEKSFKRLTGDAGRYADVILIKGRYDAKNNNIIHSGKYTQYCYGLI